MKRIELSREEMDILFDMISSKYVQSDDYKTVQVSMIWPSVKEDFHKKFIDFLEEYREYKDYEENNS